MRKVLLPVLALAAVFSASGAMAQAASAPTSATALAQSVNLSDAQSAGLVIVGLMVTMGVVLFGARLVMSKFRPKV